MTKLMIRFQEETGVDLFGGWTYEIVNGLMTPPFNESPWMKFNEWLAKQLTWRPVSEKPEKDGRYFAEVKPYTGCESTIITTAYFDGERFLWHDVVKILSDCWEYGEQLRTWYNRQQEYFGDGIVNPALIEIDGKGSGAMEVSKNKKEELK